MSEYVTTNEAKKLLKGELERRGLRFTKLTARTISFSDLARGSGVFVKVHGWESNPEWNGLKAFAREHGFFIE